MKVNDKLVEHLAHLSRLEFLEKDQIQMKSDFEKILGFVARLDMIDTSGVEPLVYMSEERNILREDQVRNQVSQRLALKNAPAKDSDYIRVPKVIKS
jgi:aspartyl-tRNA(Asn)/glutamyl-tRNA(Gln) amidotransferase subunit C